MKVAVLGNCQSHTFARCADLLVRDTRFDAKEIQSSDQNVSEILLGYKTAFVQPQLVKDIDPSLTKKIRIIPFPRISFGGLHPDNMYMDYDGARSYSPTGPYHSAIALACWYHGVSRETAKSLYTNKTFEALRFPRFYEHAKKVLIAEGAACGIDIEPLFAKWLNSELFMLTLNHPTLQPMFDVAKILVSKAGFDVLDAGLYPEHHLLKFPIMPVYPDIAHRFGHAGSFYFKRDDRRPGGAGVFDLGSFVDASYDIYDGMDRSKMALGVILREPYLSYFSTIKDKPSATPKSRRKHPYVDLPDYNRWKQSIANVKPEDVDPVVSGQFKLTKDDKVATAGSCFAQHLAKALQRSGLQYYVPETGDPAHGYGTYSARYGNVYTTAQLNQLIDRAYGRFTPVDVAWQKDETIFVDPFRPEMPLEDSSSVEALVASREKLFGFVRTMIETMDYFVFTLGLTEAWRSKADGAVFPLAPGVAAGEMDFDKYEFVNFTAEEVTRDLLEAISKIRAINPRVKFILTVSPVPLAATYESRHVLVSTTYSKSVLRIAAEAATKAVHDVFYFPSYEIITGNFNRGAYYEDDLREVKMTGVDHVMRLFLRHCTNVSEKNDELDEATLAAIEENNDILCAEDMLI